MPKERSGRCSKPQRALSPGLGAGRLAKGPGGSSQPAQANSRDSSQPAISLYAAESFRDRQQYRRADGGLLAES